MSYVAIEVKSNLFGARLTHVLKEFLKKRELNQ